MIVGQCVLQHRSDPDRPRAAVDGHLCAGCSRRLSDALRALPGLWSELEGVLAGPWTERVVDDPHPLTAAENPLPLKPAVAEHRVEMVSSLASHARRIARDRRMLPPVSEIGELCAWLDAEHDWIVHDEFSVLQADYVTEVFDLQRRALSLLDTGRRTFHLLGPCDVHTDGHGACTTEVYAQEDRDSATCKGCGFEHNVADKREWLREQLRERLGTTEEAAAFASTYHGFTVTVQAVNNWINREYVKVRGKDTQGRRLLSVEDVLVQAGMRTVRKRTGGA